MNLVLHICSQFCKFKHFFLFSGVMQKKTRTKQLLKIRFSRCVKQAEVTMMKNNREKKYTLNNSWNN